MAQSGRANRARWRPEVERRLVTEDGLLGTVRTGSVRHGGVPGSRTVRDLRGRVTWHDSDRFGGTVRARESGQTAA